jgi:hypothetical protein
MMGLEFLTVWLRETILFFSEAIRSIRVFIPLAEEIVPSAA